MTPESKVKAAIRLLLKSYGGHVFYTMPATWGRGASGSPDYLICANGVFIGVEAKAPGSKLTALQERARDAIRNAGGKFLVVSDQLSLIALKEQLDDAIGPDRLRPPA